MYIDTGRGCCLGLHIEKQRMAMWLPHSKDKRSQAGAGSLMISGESLHGAHTESLRRGHFHQWIWRHTHSGRSKGQTDPLFQAPHSLPQWILSRKAQRLSPRWLETQSNLQSGLTITGYQEYFFQCSSCSSSKSSLLVHWRRKRQRKPVQTHRMGADGRRHDSHSLLRAGQTGAAKEALCPVLLCCTNNLEIVRYS